MSTKKEDSIVIGSKEDEVCREIRDFVRKNPGTTEGRLIEHLENIPGKGPVCSKDTTRKYVKLLASADRQEIIIERDKNPINKTHHLILNDKSDFNQIDKELSKIEAMIDSVQIPLDNHIEFLRSPDFKALKGQQYFVNVEIQFKFQYQNAMEIMLRTLLVRASTMIHTESGRQQLYTRIMKLLNRVKEQSFHSKEAFDNLSAAISNFEDLKGKISGKPILKTKIGINTQLLNNLISSIEDFKKQYLPAQ